MNSYLDQANEIIAKIENCAERQLVDYEVYLAGRDFLLAEQVELPETDSLKSFDFSSAPYWIMPDDGCRPEPIRDAHDLAAHLAWLDGETD
jgi:hypothetical protein